MDMRVCIDVESLDRGISFYSQALGLNAGRRLGDGWVEMLGGPCPIDLLAEAAGSEAAPGANSERRDFGRHWTPIHLDFAVDNLDVFLARALAAGAVLERPIQERPWGRMANLADPFGHGFDLLEFKGRGYDELLDPSCD